MGTEAKITIEIFKAVTKAIAQSDNLDNLTNHLARLLVVALDIKGCTIFVLNPETEELEIMATSGLSPKYLTKGRVEADKSIAANLRGETVIVADVSKDKTLQYPEEAKKEGIAAILSIPIVFSNEILGALRLYHHQVWHVSEEDLDSLRVLAENVGLAMTYTRLINAIHAIHEVISMAAPADSLPMLENR